MKVKQCFKYIHELCINNMETNYDEKVIENIPNDFINNDFSRKMLNKIKVIFNDLLDKKDELLEFSIKYDACHESNIRSMSTHPNLCSKFIIYDTISKKILNGFLERIFYYCDTLLEYIENFPLTNEFLKDDYFFLQTCYLDWYSIIDKLAASIWMLRENKKRYSKSLTTRKNNQNLFDYKNLEPKKQEEILFDYMQLNEDQKVALIKFQNNFEKEFKNKAIIFKFPTGFNNTARKMFIHNEICYSRKFNEIILDYNTSYFGNYFIIQICFLIFSSMQIISRIYSSEIDWE